MFLESIPIAATRTYVELVLRDAEIYRQLMTNSPRFAACTESQSPSSRKTLSNLRKNALLQ